MAALGRHCRQLQAPLLKVDSLFWGAPLHHTRDPVKEHNKAIFVLMHKTVMNDSMISYATTFILEAFIVPLQPWPIR